MGGESSCNNHHSLYFILCIVSEKSCREQDDRVHHETLRENKKREISRWSLGRLLLSMPRFSLVDVGVCATQVNPREEYDIGDNDGSCCYYCSTRVSIVVEDMENGANSLHDLVVLLLCDAWRPKKDHRAPSLTSLELKVMLCLEEDSVIVFLMFHGSQCLC
jgi:hypothetical protein